MKNKEQAINTAGNRRLAAMAAHHKRSGAISIAPLPSKQTTKITLPTLQSPNQSTPNKKSPK
jgi:hypothetical protein